MGVKMSAAPMTRLGQHAPDSTTRARRIARWGRGELADEVERSLDAYVDVCYANNETPATLRNKRVILRQLFVEYGELTPVTCREYADAHGLASSTTRSYMSVARNYTRWLVDTGRADFDPFYGFRLPRKSRPRPKPFSKEVAEDYIARADGLYKEWFTLAYYAGLRAIEISRICGRDLVEGSKGWELLVHAKGSVENSVPAHPRVVELMYGKPAGRLYKANADSVSSMSRNHLLTLGLDRGGIHRFRHTFGTELYFATHDIRLVQAMMRHESIESTLCYVALDDTRHRRAIDAL